MAQRGRIKPTMSILCATIEVTTNRFSPVSSRPPPDFRYFSVGHLKRLQNTTRRKSVAPALITHAEKDDIHIPWETAPLKDWTVAPVPPDLPQPYTLPPPPWPQDYLSPSTESSWLDRPQTSRFVAGIKLDGELRGVDVTQLRGLTGRSGNLLVSEVEADVPQLSKNKRKRLRRSAVDRELKGQAGSDSEAVDLSRSAQTSSQKEEVLPEKLIVDDAQALDEEGRAVQQVLTTAASTEMVANPTVQFHGRRRTQSNNSAASSLNSGRRRPLRPAPPRTKARMPRPQTSAKSSKHEPELSGPKPKKEEWQTQKASLTTKFPAGWSPPRRLSPDALEGIRALHVQYPDRFTTPVLADHFKVSPEAIRRILKSKWRPNPTEDESRRERWDKRGEKIWTGLVERGVHAPKKWREMGIGTGPRRAGQDRSDQKGRASNGDADKQPRALRDRGGSVEIPWA